MNKTVCCIEQNEANACTMHLKVMILWYNNKSEYTDLNEWKSNNIKFNKKNIEMK